MNRRKTASLVYAETLGSWQVVFPFRGVREKEGDKGRPGTVEGGLSVMPRSQKRGDVLRGSAGPLAGVEVGSLILAPREGGFQAGGVYGQLSVPHQQPGPGPPDLLRVHRVCGPGWNEGPAPPCHLPCSSHCELG